MLSDAVQLRGAGIGGKGPSKRLLNYNCTCAGFSDKRHSQRKCPVKSSMVFNLSGQSYEMVLTSEHSGEGELGQVAAVAEAKLVAPSVFPSSCGGDL